MLMLQNVLFYATVTVDLRQQKKKSANDNECTLKALPLNITPKDSARSDRPQKTLQRCGRLSAAIKTFT